MDIGRLRDLINHPLVNKAELARRMFPNNKFADRNLANKLAGKQGRRLTDADYIRIKNIFGQLSEQIQRAIEDTGRDKREGE